MSRLHSYRGIVFRIPRRLVRGQEQKPHPHIAWAIRKEAYRREYREYEAWLVAGGNPQTDFLMWSINKSIRETYSEAAIQSPVYRNNPFFKLLGAT